MSRYNHQHICAVLRDSCQRHRDTQLPPQSLGHRSFLHGQHNKAGGGRTKTAHRHNERVAGINTHSQLTHDKYCQSHGSAWLHFAPHAPTQARLLPRSPPTAEACRLRPAGPAASTDCLQPGQQQMQYTACLHKVYNAMYKGWHLNT